MKVEKDPRPLVCPNPVVLVTTVDANMRPNAITLTLVGAVCGQPPMISIRIGVEQHSRSLIDEKGEVDLGKADPILFNLTNSYWEIGKKLADYGFSRSRARQQEEWLSLPFPLDEVLDPVPCDVVAHLGRGMLEGVGRDAGQGAGYSPV